MINMFSSIFKTLSFFLSPIRCYFTLIELSMYGWMCLTVEEEEADNYEWIIDSTKFTRLTSVPVFVTYLLTEYMYEDLASKVTKPYIAVLLPVDKTVVVEDIVGTQVEVTKDGCTNIVTITEEDLEGVICSPLELWYRWGIFDYLTVPLKRIDVRFILQYIVNSFSTDDPLMTIVSNIPFAGTGLYTKTGHYFGDGLLDVSFTYPDPAPIVITLILNIKIVMFACTKVLIES